MIIAGTYSGRVVLGLTYAELDGLVNDRHAAAIKTDADIHLDGLPPQFAGAVVAVYCHDEGSVISAEDSELLAQAKARIHVKITPETAAALRRTADIIVSATGLPIGLLARDSDQALMDALRRWIKPGTKVTSEGFAPGKAPGFTDN